MEAFAILRAEKISQEKETAVHNHNLRASSTKKENNIDYKKSHLNKLILGDSHTVKKINEKIDALGQKKKMRSNINRAVELVLSASPEHFYDFEKSGMTREEWDKLIPANFEGRMDQYWSRLNEVKSHLKIDNLKQWLEDSKNWVVQEFGDNIVNVIAHFDEKTPHLHMVCTPIVNGRLSARDFYTPEKARHWQASYALATGLKKGISSDKKHEDLKSKNFEAGKLEGYDLGRIEGYDSGKVQGHQEGYDEGHSQGYQEGSDEGRAMGFEDGKRKGYEVGKKKGFDRGYEKGYADGQEQGSQGARTVGNFFATVKDKLSGPTEREQQAIAEAQKKAQQAEEKAQRTQNRADNRVTTVADELRAEKLRTEQLEKELLDTQAKLEAITTVNIPKQGLKNK
ncbi:MAG: MobV family relaxase [Anaerovoracaceae bacterium]